MHVGGFTVALFPALFCTLFLWNSCSFRSINLVYPLFYPFYMPDAKREKKSDENNEKLKKG
jgi:hypothetical protein